MKARLYIEQETQPRRTQGFYSMTCSYRQETQSVAMDYQWVGLALLGSTDGLNHRGLSYHNYDLWPFSCLACSLDLIFQICATPNISFFLWPKTVKTGFSRQNRQNSWGNFHSQLVGFNKIRSKLGVGCHPRTTISHLLRGRILIL